MSEDQANRRDPYEVLADALDGTAGPEELEKLRDDLREDAEFRERACRFLVDDSLISEIVLPSREAEGLFGGAPAPHAPKGIAPAEKNDTWLGLFYGNVGYAVAAVAAALLIGVSVLHLQALREIERLHSLAIVEGQPGGPAEGQLAGGSSGQGDERAALKSIGRVSGIDGVEWEEGATPLAFGESVEQGRVVSLRSGVLELLLTTGAKVTIQGPAKFEAGSTLETTLDHGKIAAAVPRAARGFTIFTPTSEVVDLGTQFGVAVDDAGDTEVHVFEGDVVARSRLKNASTKLVHAQQNEAVKFDSRSDQPQRFVARTSDFVRRLGPEINPEALPGLPVTEGLEVWYSADFVSDELLNRPVTTWRDLLVGDNDFPDDAWQFEEHRCPILLRDDAGRNALRFNGWTTYLETAPMETGDRQTAFVVYAAGPTSFANNFHGGILLKYPSVPSIEVAVFGDRSTHGWVWPGPDSPGNVGVVRSTPVEGEGVAVVAYSYDAVEGHAELWNNGVSQGVAPAPVRLQQAGQRYVGRHPDQGHNAAFFGNIYEVVIFDAALSGDAMTAMNDYFAQRYGIGATE